MKFLPLSLVTALLLLFGSVTHAQTLNIFGSSGFTVDPFNTGVPLTQGPAALTINGAIVVGDNNILAGTFAQTNNWSGVAEFGLTMSVSSLPNPNLFFTLELVDTNFATVGTFTGSTGDWGSSSELVALTEVFRGDLSNVVGMNFTFNDAGTINMTLENISVVPEPSTWALFTATVLVSAFLAWRRRSLARR